MKRIERKPQSHDEAGSHIHFFIIYKGVESTGLGFGNCETNEAVEVVVKKEEGR